MSLTNCSNWSSEDLIEALNKVDKELRPIVIYTNPQDEELLTKALGDMVEQLVIKPCELVEAGKAYAFNRKALEDDIKRALNYPKEV